MSLRAWFSIAAAILALAAGCSKREETRRAATVEASGQSVGPWRVSIATKPVRPIVGENKLEIAVEDSTGRPVTGASLGAIVFMEAMGAMPRMESRAEFRETGPGRYEATYGLQMQGDWDLTLTIRPPGAPPTEALYRISTRRTGVTFAGGSSATNAATASLDGVVTIDPARRQAIGIRTAPVAPQDLIATIRAAGRVAYDETRRAEISLKFSGWIRTIRVDYVGRPVKRGEVLFTVYSPELLSAQQEYLESLRGRSGGDLALAAKQRLLLWDIDPATIDEITASGRPMDELPILAPASGVVVEKNVVAGTSFTAGQTLYRIASIDPVWVVASVFQQELPLVKVGMTAGLAPAFPGEPARSGRVSYVNPFLDPVTRTGEVRVVVPNPKGDLKPGMFVDVLLERSLGRKLAVPESAVLYAGDRRLVFVDLGDGRLAARDVSLGPKAGDQYEILGGLREGDVVVTSGNFLVAAEARLRSATQKW